MKNQIARSCVFGLFIAVAACSGKNPLTGSGTVVYRVTGSAARADLTFATEGGGTSQQANAILPWTTNIAAHDGYFLYLSAQNDGQTGCVHVEILSGNKTLNDAQSCGAFVIATASATY